MGGSWRPWRSHRGVQALAAALFAATALGLFLFRSNDSDVYLYQRYAEACQRDGFTGLYRAVEVEYPPLAVAGMAATRSWAGYLPATGPLFSQLPVYRVDPGFRQYKLAYRLEMLGVHVLAFAGLVGLLRRCFAHEEPAEHLERLLVFIAGGVILGHLLYDRFDLVLGAGVLFALGLLVGRAHFGCSFLVLAAAVDLKVVPVILTPVWVLASLPADLWNGPESIWKYVRLLRACVARSLALAALILLWLVPFYRLAGRRCLSFLEFHRDRGIEFESTYAGLLAVLKTAGYPVHVRSGHGSGDVISGLSSLLAGLAPWLVGVALLSATGLLVQAVRRSARDVPAGTSMGRARPGLVIAFTLFFLTIFMSGNKVFSPQYLLWLLPLVPLVGGPRRVRWGLWGTFLGLCTLTWLIFPKYLPLIVGAQSAADPLVADGPTPAGAALLLGRGLLMLGLTAGLFPTDRAAESHPAPA